MTSRHILIVEDEEKIASLLCDYLKEAGFRTSTQNNGARVIAQKLPGQEIISTVYGIGYKFIATFD